MAERSSDSTVPATTSTKLTSCTMAMFGGSDGEGGCGGGCGGGGSGGGAGGGHAGSIGMHGGGGEEGGSMGGGSVQLRSVGHATPDRANESAICRARGASGPPHAAQSACAVALAAVRLPVLTCSSAR